MSYNLNEEQMRVSFNWLKDYVDIKISAARLAEILTMAGLMVDSIDRVGEDHVFEIEVTANRPDWLSYIGVAREISAVTSAKLKMPKATLNHKTIKPSNHPTIKVDEKSLCPRYTARIIRDVKVGESPAWLKRKIEVMGLRPVNNIVDVTNFCLFETGEPMHAFDSDKLEGRQIVVRKAHPGEKITTIDRTERTLDNSDLVIADHIKLIAIAGVMGSLDTEVRATTKNILLEAAYFDPISVRRTSRKYSLSTESSYRFERKVDINNIANASDRAASLILEIAGGRPGEFFDTSLRVDVGGAKGSKRAAEVRYSRLDSIMGCSIAPRRARKILNSLGLATKASSKDRLKLEVPNFRYDLNNEIDIIEEVARIYGYDRIPKTLPNVVESLSRMPYEMIVEKAIRQALVGLGLDEIMTYSLSSRKTMEDACLPDADMVEISNPLTSEQEIMRPSLVAGMLNAVLWNTNRKNKDLRLFELGRVYMKEGALFAEKRHLSIGMTGEANSSWLAGSRPAGFFDIKAVTEALLSELGISNIDFKFADAVAAFTKGAGASIAVGQDSIGILGEVSANALHNFDIKQPTYICEICIDSILKYAQLGKRYKELPKYPSVYRDISIMVDSQIKHLDLTRTIQANATAILKDIRLIDRYIGPQIPKGKVGLTYRLEYQDLNRTLEDKDVLDSVAKILEALEAKHGAKLR